MSQGETNMQVIVEDLSEEMKREREEEMRSGRGGAPSLFFFELSNMSLSVGLLYMLFIIGFFGVIFYVLINKIINKPIDLGKGSKKRASKTGSNKKLE